MDTQHLQTLLEELNGVREKIALPDPSNELHDSVLNLREYLNLRRHDLSHLQDELTKAGLSSLGRSQSHIVATLDASISLLCAALGKEPPVSAGRVGYEQAHRIMKKNSELFSKSTKKTKIMITVPSNYRDDPEWFKDLSDEGVDLFRINTAHDTPSEWEEMASLVHTERKRHNRDIKVYVDLAGPKIRTADIGHPASLVALGAKKANREFYLCPLGTASTDRPASKPLLYVDGEFLENLSAASTFEIVDIDGVAHTVHLFKKNRHGHKFYADQKFLVSPGCILRHHQDGVVSETPLHGSEGESKGIRVHAGDKLLITSTAPGDNAPKRLPGGYDAHIGCTLEGVAERVKAGEKVFIDDGKIELVIDAIEAEGIVCTVVTNKPNGVVIKPEKGINFPGTPILLDALSDHDRAILPEVVRFADIVGISFTQTPEDIQAVIRELEGLGKSGEIGIVAKIETQQGVENLPAILEALIAYGRSGIMIARGDLAIEIGYENLAYMQEEILDLCAAAHMPVILATQVLESKMKTNIPSRAEITDAAFAHKAECVMLNKGEYARETITILNAIFRQMDFVFRKNKLLLNPTFQWR